MKFIKTREEEAEHAHKAFALYTNRRRTVVGETEHNKKQMKIAPFSLSVVAEEHNILT